MAVWRSGGIAGHPAATELLSDDRVKVIVENEAAALLVKPEQQVLGTQAMKRFQTFTVKETADGWKIDALAGDTWWGGFTPEK